MAPSRSSNGNTMPPTEQNTVNRALSGIKAAGLTVLISAAIAGCSGNSADNTPTDNFTSYNGIELHGTAAKGIINKGVISAQELDSLGQSVATVGSAETDDSGRYQLTLTNYRGGPLLLTLSSGPDTTMRCDVVDGCGPRMDDSIRDSNNSVDFGEWYIPAPFTLTALLPRAGENETITLSITPFTHMAAQYARAQTHIDSNTIANTNSAVSNLLGGLDILNTEPIDITNPASVNNAAPSRVTYAAIAAAIANLASPNGDKSPDIETALTILSHSFRNGTFPANDSTAPDQDANLFSLQEILDASQRVFTAAAITDITGTTTTLAAKINNATDTDGDGIPDITPTPSDSATDTELAKVKALMADIRTWGSVINNQIELPGNAFRRQITLSLEAAEAINTLYISELLYLSAKAIANYHATDDKLPVYRDFGVTSPRWPNGFSRGTITTPSAGLYLIEDAALEPVITGNDYLTMNLSVQTPIDGSTSNRFTYGIVDATISGPYADLTINSGTVTLNLREAYTVNTRESLAAIEAALIDLTESIEIELDLTLTQKWDLHNSAITTLGGNPDEPVQHFYEDPITFAGTFTTTVHPVVENSPAEVTWFAPATVALSGHISNSSGDNLSASIAANMANANLFIPVSTTQTEGPDNWLQVDASPDTANPNLGLSFSLQLDELPEAAITITADRTGFEAGDVELTIAFDNRQLRIASSGDAAADNIISEIVITNQDGARLTLNTEAGQRRGTFSFNGNQYGSLEETASGYLKISYIDGTFEIF